MKDDNNGRKSKYGNLKKMFETHGLSVYGTAEQNKKYNDDKHAYDYIKGTLDHMAEYSKRYASDEITQRYSHTGTGQHLTVVNQKHNGKIQSEDVKIFMYQKGTFTDEISVDELYALHDKDYIEQSEDMLNLPMTNAISDTLKKQLHEMYKEKIERQRESKNCIENLTPIRTVLDRAEGLTSEKGFYIGDPKLVLKDEILNALKKGPNIETGLFHVGEQKMVITHATNGPHNGHDIYSGTLGIIPIEMLDPNKVKLLPHDDLDIRLGKHMNVMMKGGSLYIAQGEIEEIDIRHTDQAYDPGGVDYGFE